MRYCFYTETHGQGIDQNRLPPPIKLRRRSTKDMFAIVSTPEYVARVIGQNRVIGHNMPLRHVG